MKFHRQYITINTYLMIGRVTKLVVISRTGDRSQVLHNLQNNTVSYHMQSQGKLLCFKHEDILLTLLRIQHITAWPHIIHSLNTDCDHCKNQSVSKSETFLNKLIYFLPLRHKNLNAELCLGFITT